jgi:YWFCY protein/TraM recognition site of TraD and TraG
MNKEMAAGQRSIAQLSETISYCLLGLDIYYRCYWLFDHWGFTSKFSDKIIARFVAAGLVEGFTGRIAMIFFLALALASAPGRRSVEVNRRQCYWRMGPATLVFLMSPVVFIRIGDPMTTCLVYLVITLAAYLVIMHSGGRLIRSVRLPWDKDDPFGRKQAGFPQEQRRLGGSDALHLRSEHQWKVEKRKGWINLINPRRGILILGSPGSGKSRFIIEPLMRQLMEKGNALFVYDYKFPALTQLAYRWFQAYRHRYPGNTRFYCIQFGDLSRSHRCNLLAPETLEWVSDALGAARTIFLSMNPTWVDKQGEFFVESPINFLGMIIWYLRKHDNGKYCTLPHAIELAQYPYDRLFAILERVSELKALVEPFAQAFRNMTFEVLDSQISSARIPLARLASPDLYYLLTGNDLRLDINDPKAPKILCLAGDPRRVEALAPILSLYIDRLNRLCNQPGRYPCAMICDEFATVRAYSMTTTIATGRSHRITPVLAVQDFSQLRTQYSRNEADLFLNIAGNVFCGQVGGETARWMSERFPTIQQEKPSISNNSTDMSVSTTLQREPTVNQATIAGLSSGEFVGVLSDEPGMELELKVFHGKILRENAVASEPVYELPVVREIDEEGVKAEFERVKEDISVLVAAEFELIEKGEAKVAIGPAIQLSTTKTNEHATGKRIRGGGGPDQKGADGSIPERECRTDQ